MTLIQIVMKYLIENHYDGLANINDAGRKDCSCNIEELMACEAPDPQCRPYTCTLDMLFVEGYDAITPGATPAADPPPPSAPDRAAP